MILPRNSCRTRCDRQMAMCSRLSRGTLSGSFHSRLASKQKVEHVSERKVESATADDVDDEV